MVNKVWAHSSIFFFFNTIPCGVCAYVHTLPLKYGCPFKICNQFKHDWFYISIVQDLEVVVLASLTLSLGVQ